MDTIGRSHQEPSPQDVRTVTANLSQLRGESSSSVFLVTILCVCVATIISRLFEIKVFCKKDYSAKKTYDLKESTNHSHPTLCVCLLSAHLIVCTVGLNR